MRNRVVVIVCALLATAIVAVTVAAAAETYGSSSTASKPAMKPTAAPAASSSAQAGTMTQKMGTPKMRHTAKPERMAMHRRTSSQRMAMQHRKSNTRVAMHRRGAMHRMATGRSVTVSINGRRQHYTVPARMVRGTVMVPVREVYDSLGATVGWMRPEREVTIAHGTSRIQLIAGQRYVMIDGRQLHLAQPMTIVGRHAYVPASLLRESGVSIAWNRRAREIMIATAGAPQQMSSMPRGQSQMSQPEATPAQPSTSEPAGGMDATVNVTLVDGSIKLRPTEVPAGKTTFALANSGTLPHSLAIDGISINAPTLRAGQKGSVTVDLKPGTYTLYCPVDGHRAMGMLAKLIVR